MSSKVVYLTKWRHIFSSVSIHRAVQICEVFIISIFLYFVNNIVFEYTERRGSSKVPITLCVHVS